MMIDKVQKNIWINSGKLDAEKLYWLHKLEGHTSFTRIPTDHGVKSGGDFDKQTVSESIPPMLWNRMNEISKGSDYARLTILLAGLQILLTKHTNNTHIAVGMPTFVSNNQNAIRLNEFVPLTARVNEDSPFKQLLGETKQAITEASANANYPIEHLAELLSWSVDGQGFPWFHTLVTYSPLHDSTAPSRISYDIHFHFSLEADGLVLSVEYNGLLYNKETMMTLIRHYIAIISQSLQSPSEPLGQLAVIPAEEQADIEKKAEAFQRLAEAALQREKRKALFHPLMERFVEQSVQRWVIETELNVSKAWELSEHGIAGHPTLPGAVFLEVAAYGARAYFNQAVQLEHVQIHAPLILTNKRTKRFRTSLQLEKGQLHVRVESAEDIAALTNAWTLHATCIASRMTTARPDAVAMNTQVAQSGNHELRSAGYGPRWQAVESYQVGDSETLIQVKLPDEFIEDLTEYDLHPALLELCTSPLTEDAYVYLPVFCKKVQIFGALPQQLISQVTPKSSPLDNHNHVSYDIHIRDTAGSLLVYLEDYTLRRIAEVSSLDTYASQLGLFYQASWTPIQEAERIEREQDGAVLLLRDDSTYHEQLSLHYRSQGWDVVEVFQSEQFGDKGEGRFTVGTNLDDYKQLSNALANQRLSHIVHLLHATEKQSITSISELERTQDNGVWSLFYMMKALDASLFNEQTQLFVIVRNAYATSASDTPSHPEHAPLIGLAKVIADEYPHLTCRGMDIDASVDAQQLYTLLQNRQHPLFTAYRSGTAYVEMLEEKLAMEQYAGSAGFPVVQDGVYLISGGTGGLGIEIAKHLSLEKPIRLALISRTQFPNRSEWDAIITSQDRKRSAVIRMIREIEARGSKVELYAADVSNATRMKEVITDINDRLGLIRGVIHAAGLAGDSLIKGRDSDTFRNVLLPKINGTYVLVELTKQQPIDFFVLFSSIATLSGSSGLGDYTAANSYLDAFAEARNRLGKRTLCINWSGWSETGMVVEYGTEDTFFKGLKTETAIHALKTALASHESRVIVGQLNLYHPVFEQYERLPIRLAPSIIQQIQMALPIARRDNTSVSAAGAADASNPIEAKVSAIICQLLGLDQISVEDSFFEVGGHSILAIKLMVELGKNGFNVDGLDIYEVSTVKAISEFVATRGVVNV